MKNVIKLALCSVAFISISALEQQSSAQTTLPGEAAQQQASTNEESITQTVRVRVTEVEGIELKTQMVNLSVSAVQEGLGNLSLNGFMTEQVLPNGATAMTIQLNEASLFNSDTGEINTTTLEPSFNASVVPNPEIQVSNQFDLEIDPVELLAAFQRLQPEAESLVDEDLIEEEEENGQLADNQGTQQADTTNPTQDLGVSPNFQVDEAVSPNVVTELCDPRIDLDQLAAIEQERTIVDGVEGECTDTLTRYPLQQRFSACPVQVDLANLQAFQGFEYFYETETSGVIVATSCQADTTNPIPITETSNGCGIVHDFDAGLSVQQTQFVFNNNGVQEIAQSCQDSASTFNHQVTTNGCNPVITATDVTFAERVIISVNGVEQEIASCAPNLATTQSIQSEECLGGQRYTHDFVAGQSQLNETFFYFDENNNRVDLSTCQPGTTTFNHLLDQTNCTPNNDDVARETTFQSQTFIEDPVGTQVFLSGCEDELPAIPYSANGSVWRVNNTSTAQIALTPSETTELGLSQRLAQLYVDGFRSSVPANLLENLDNYWSRSGRFVFTRFAQDPLNNFPYAIFESNSNSSIFVNWQAYCVFDELTGSRTTTSGIPIDLANSDQQPSWTTQPSPQRGGDNISTGVFYEFRHTGDRINCSIPSCTLSELRARPQFLRGDGSLFEDTSISTGTTHVCGTGSLLEGEQQ